jgi:transcriptional regulator with XRE-family HTH domain
MKIHVGNNIKRIRLNKGLTQKELAKKLNFSTQYISNIEQLDLIHLDLLLQIAKTLQVSYSELLGLSSSPNVQSDIHDELKQIIF